MARKPSDAVRTDVGVKAIVIVKRLGKGGSDCKGWFTEKKKCLGVFSRKSSKHRQRKIDIERCSVRRGVGILNELRTRKRDP